MKKNAAYGKKMRSIIIEAFLFFIVLFLYFYFALFTAWWPGKYEKCKFVESCIKKKKWKNGEKIRIHNIYVLTWHVCSQPRMQVHVYRMVSLI